jgi:hypothetical protein
MAKSRSRLGGLLVNGLDCLVLPSPLKEAIEAHSAKRQQV